MIIDEIIMRKVLDQKFNKRRFSEFVIKIHLNNGRKESLELRSKF